MARLLQLNMDEAINKSLRRLNYSHIRPNQEKVVKAYLQGKDVLFCSPTGSGKSLTFEIAPFVFKSLNVQDGLSSVIVISPLIALMKYQAESISQKDIKAVYLHDIPDDITLKDIHEGKCDIVLASPESLLGEHRSLLTDMSNAGALKAVFIDEAHCIKKFGKVEKSQKQPAYRPAYGKLGEIRSLIRRDIPVIALTATATEATRTAIIQEMCMTNCEQVIVSPNKPNIKYSVEKVGSDVCQNFKWLLDLLSEKGTSCPRVIVFFRQIKHLAEVFEFLQVSLQEKQYATVHNRNHNPNSYRNRIFAMFHLTTCDKIKAEICSSFREESGLTRVVLCSTSFSMGLDVKCVNTVIHYGPSNDTDDYIQESGRAGRNPDVDSNAILMKHKYSMNSTNISSAMKQYVATTICRRKQLMSPFVSIDTELSIKPLHKCCDVCTHLCKCKCSCSTLCSCVGPVCDFQESGILQAIRQSMTKPVPDEDSEDSDQELEELQRRKPQIVSDSDESV